MWKGLSDLSGCACRALQPRGLGEVDPEPVPLALVAAGHLGTRVAELFLHVAFVGLRGGGEAGAQRMSGELLPPLGFGQITTDAGGQRRTLDQPGHMLVGQPIGPSLLAAAPNPPEQRPVGDAAELQPCLQGDDRAGGCGACRSVISGVFAAGWNYVR
jgi:hypothetical protein